MGGKIEINKDETHPKEYHVVVFFFFFFFLPLPHTWRRQNRLSALTTEAVGGGEEMAAVRRASAGVGREGGREGVLDTYNAVSSLCSRQRQTAFSWISDGSDNKSRGSLATLKFRKGFSTAVCAFFFFFFNPPRSSRGESAASGEKKKKK